MWQTMRKQYLFFYVEAQNILSTDQKHNKYETKKNNDIRIYNGILNSSMNLILTCTYK